MRLFVAVDIPDELKARIETDVVDRLRAVEGARWSRPEGRHLTLKFIGNVEEALVPDIGDAVRAAAKGHRRFSAAFAELGGFPDLRRPRVLWVGVAADEMGPLASDIERALVPLGIPAEGRPFRGHLTLARFPRPRLIGELPDVVVPAEPFDVGEVVLFRSHLHPKGARYSVLERFPLRAE